jgi:hypothetical protein
MVSKQLAKGWAEHRRQRDEKERQSRVMVITEFDAGDPEATLHALADEILKYRRAVGLLAKAIGWADAGAPFAVLALASRAWTSLWMSSPRSGPVPTRWSSRSIRARPCCSAGVRATAQDRARASRSPHAKVLSLLR